MPVLYPTARRGTYGDLSEPAITITVASPASAWLEGLTGSRWAMPSRRLTARASA